MNDETLGEYNRTTPDPDETTGEALARLQAELARLLDEADAELRDEADGGVAAALVEKEAETRDVAHDIDWQAVAEQHEAALAAMTEDRDRVLDLVRDADMGRDLAVERAERAEQERDEARGALSARLGARAEPRSLTPHTVPSETVERARAAWINAGGRVYAGLTSDLRHALAAALTEPPTRPEWADDAEDIEAALREEWTFSDEDGGEEAFADLAERLARRGVRVVGEERS